ncbi:aromatic/aminoadipate aminotransferase 1 [Aspergillus tubingensis]|uniref:Phospho-2-dehydro-3-deoxyheptonate aldolase n=2 Tax=Aspergillus subgen. Circumdati TaxID=2720871 RepID=A0A8H3SPJ0_ASPTU|nr:phospho-2-dehydro-3-deoxyheptonate aldolase, class II [Aspergillus costaricaensis CBS 115574]XP_035353870.1 phospho-2-dehydro-3-deoxyheptonate aldolase, class II [Aspergillus tubingensis]RAK86505.1 phospho-2-dehydro-3-deoxyheptonate aldolase, class II [Aspergillus costaricaensis CBS 115574]GFN13066.1 phospho-2-dehydro-3-deoxyheptonate aldolase, class II [Aspergillus tubingensis]GLA75433.1 aromatic/aminoadipate aminotransferase 1 [Aspergillus tubingensis]GLA82266.1 aromatic/aminoadipate amin
MAESEWSPSSWASKPIKQDVVYDDAAGVQAALAKLQKLPPLVTTQEVNDLKKSLKNVALGKAFVLQGGDCAELFDYCNMDMIEAKVKLLLQMSLVLIWGANKPVVRIARIAGQFAKPRSSPMETIDGVEMPSFRGDNINGFDATPESRKPDPSRLVSAYFHSAATLNYMRASLSSGLADLHSPLDWGLGHVITPSIREKYTKIVNRVKDALRFMQTVGIDTDRGVETVDIYTSHEGLLLEYEQSLLRHLKNPDPPTTSTQPLKSYYATSSHFLWIGDRTRQINGAHVEFFRGIANPIGIKIGPSMTPAELTSLLDIVNPAREIGKVTLISRYGAAKISQYLPAHIAAVQASGHIPVWQCDPMHGNTQATPSGVKTRHFSDILSELKQALEIHRAAGSFLGGMHLELTGEAVTECVGGAGGLTEEGLSERYTTFCDPRLNEKQALELAFLVAGFYRELDEELAEDESI